MPRPPTNGRAARPGLLFDAEVIAKLEQLRETFGEDRDTDLASIRVIHILARRKAIERANDELAERDETNVVRFPGR